MPSSVVSGIKYDPTKQVLRVYYVSGMVYDYKKVPPQVYQSMIKAFSKGTYLNRYIKGHYDFEKVQWQNQCYLYSELLIMSGPVIYIMGVSGSGKTTVGKILAARLQIPFFDADDYHSLANKEKMKSGIALTDKDREGWLATVNKIAIENSSKSGAIIACSALKEMYRTILEQGISTRVKWVWLQGDYDLIQNRMEARKNHYMPASLLRSQFQTLEPPQNAIMVSIEKTPEEIGELVVRQIKDKN